jgi:hypothetical protein
VQQQLCSVLLVACPRPGGRRRGTSWHRDASAGYGSDLESLGFPADEPSEPLEGHERRLVGLEYEEVSLAPEDIRPRWPGGFLKALLAEQL